jgi:WD40 repeat protein
MAGKTLVGAVLVLALDGASLRSTIDAEIRAGWEARKPAPASRSDDATFLRRITLDLLGTLPAADEVRAFLADPGQAKVWLLDASTGRKLQELARHEYGVTGLAFHPDGRQLASCGRDTVVRLWSLADGKTAKELGIPRGGQFKDWIHAVAISADGAWLAAPDMAGQVHVWSLA